MNGGVNLSFSGAINYSFPAKKGNWLEDDDNYQL